MLIDMTNRFCRSMPLDLANRYVKLSIDTHCFDYCNLVMLCRLMPTMVFTIEWYVKLSTEAYGFD